LHWEPVGPPLFTVALTGAGNVGFVIGVSSSQFEFDDVKYRFASVKRQEKLTPFRH